MEFDFRISRNSFHLKKWVEEMETNNLQNTHFYKKALPELLALDMDNLRNKEGGKMEIQRKKIDKIFNKKMPRNASLSNNISDISKPLKACKNAVNSHDKKLNHAR